MNALQPRSRTFVFTVLLIAALFLSGCFISDTAYKVLDRIKGAADAPAQPTATRTALPYPTPSPYPTNTPAPAFDPAAYEPQLDMIRQIVPQAYFSFRPLEDYELTLGENAARLVHEDYEILIMVEGFDYGLFTSEKMEALLDDLLGYYNKDGQADFAFQGDAQDLLVDGIAGVQKTFAGKSNSVQYQGSLIVFGLDKHRFVVITTLANDTFGQYPAVKISAKDTLALAETLQFLSPETIKRGCVIASDPTYGFSKDNPIRVGGGDFDGPPRERVFLDNLTGKDGKPVEYVRTGSVNYNGTILDEYLLTVPGKGLPLTLFIDEYSFDDLYAPVGLTCQGYFGLEEPRAE